MNLDNFLLSLYRFAYRGRKPHQKKSSAPEVQAEEYESLIKNDPKAAYQFCMDMGSEATKNYNDAISDRRNVYTSIFMTSGTFLTVALPLLSTNEIIASSLIFKLITFLLLASLLIGIWSSLKEWTFESSVHNRIIKISKSAALFIRSGQADQALVLFKELTDEKKRFGSDIEIIKTDLIIKMRKLALILFFFGITAFALLMVFSDFSKSLPTVQEDDLLGPKKIESVSNDGY